MYAMSNKIQQISIPYSNECGTEKQCTLTIKVDEDIEGPLFTYYELNNFYQNHRRYVKSRSYAQLMGDKIDEAQAKKDCDPIITNEDMGKTVSVDGSPLNKDDIAIPCGLIAKSLFTDKYKIFKDENDADSEIKINSENIAWNSDREFKFKNQDGDWEKKQWHNV